MKGKLKKVLCGLGLGLFSMAFAMSLPQTTETAKAAAVEINEKNFPGKIFREYVSNFDTDGNEILSDDELQKVTSIDVHSKGISNLTGLQYFTNLESLDCSDNELEGKALDVSKNRSLQTLDCSHNKLTELNVSDNNYLKNLYCNNNNLSTLNISMNVRLEYLNCGSNTISSLNLNVLTSLKVLICNDNTLTDLNVSNNTILEQLSCQNNPLSKGLSVTANTSLKILECDKNNLTELKLSNNTSLGQLSCQDNNLKELDVSSNASLRVLKCSNNKLTKLDLSNNPSLEGTLYCSGNELTELKLNWKCYSTLILDKSNLHGDNTTLSDISNATEENGIITLVDITRPASYKYSVNSDDSAIDFTIVYVDSTAVTAFTDRLFRDYEYKDPVSGTAVTIFGNAASINSQKQRGFYKDFVAYTDILASYSYTVDSKGRLKASSSKVIVGLTMSKEKPTVTARKKIVDKDAAKIAKAKISYGRITVTATGKAEGTVYLWIIDTGSKGEFECCPINVKLAPKKLEIYDTTGSKAKNLKIANEGSADIVVSGLVGKTKADNFTYTYAVDSKSEPYVSIEKTDGNHFRITALGLKNEKNTKVSITFTCNENGKKIKLKATITK